MFCFCHVSASILLSETARENGNISELANSYGLDNHLQEWERLRVARAKSPCEALLRRWYPRRAHATERQRRLAAQTMVRVHGLPWARRRRGIVHCAVPPLAEGRTAVMQHCIATSSDGRLRLRRLFDQRWPWAHWRLWRRRRLPVNVRRWQCGCLLKCFSVECQEVLLEVLDLHLQCGNLPYQLISGLAKNISWIWWIYYSWIQ